MRSCIFVLLSIILSGCTSLSYVNTECKTDQGPPRSKASIHIGPERGNEEALVILSLSGGGSRAAYLSSKVMLRLQDVFEDADLLQEVDAISSVSGGSLASAYYCFSINPGKYRVVKVFSEPINELFSDELKDLQAENRLVYDAQKKLLKFKGEMAESQKNDLKKCFPNDIRSQEKIETLYNNSKKKVKSTRKWDEKTVTDAMTKNYTARWVGNWFWPNNLVLYWSTSYDRSNIMARTFSDNLFDVGYDWDNFFTPWRYGDDLKFKDINAERPYLIINATDATARAESVTGPISIRNENGNEKELEPSTFGRIFTFTTEIFYEQLNSDIKEYPIGYAVMASSAFPAVFNYVTMRNYTNEGGEKNYVHVFDGGNTDNLGITSVKNILERYEKENERKIQKVVIILVDAYTKPIGIDREKSDSRTSFFLERFVDLNIMDSFDSLLSANRRHKLMEFKNWFKEMYPNNSIFFHITFEALPDTEVELKENLNKIPTNFSITDENTRHIDDAIGILLNENNAELKRIKNLLIDQ